MGYSRIYTEILRMWRKWALRKKNADSDHAPEWIQAGRGDWRGATHPDPLPTRIEAGLLRPRDTLLSGQVNGFAVTPDGRLYGWGINNGNAFAQSVPTNYFYTPTG